MKKTRIIDLIQIIKKTKTSWIAILIFILTSISFNFGLGWSDDMVINSFDKDFTDFNTRDVELFSFYGFDEENLKEISDIPEVESVEGIHCAFADIRHDGNWHHVAVRELSDDIDRLQLLEGSFPEEPDQVVIDKGWADRNSIKVGDQIEFQQGLVPEDDSDEYDISGSEPEYGKLTISGIVANPAYSCSVEGTYGEDTFTGDGIDVLLYANIECFSDQDSPCQIVLIKGAELSGLRFDSQEYGDKCEALADVVIDKAKEIEKKKYDELLRQMEMYGQVDLPYFEGFVQTRPALSKLVSVNIMTGIMKNTSYCLSVMFLIIALLVSYVAITRMVNLQKVQIGTKKAFGFNTGQIVRYYICYTVTSVIIGYLVGGLLGILFEYILGNYLTSVYYINSVCLYFGVSEYLILFLMLLAVVMAITVGAVITICRRDAIDLLNQTEISKVKHSWYEKLPGWNKLSLLNQTIIKNCTTDKRRVLGTLISVACCMALFVCAVTFFYNIKFSVNTQFDRYFHFDTYIEYDEDVEPAYEDIKNVLDDKGLRSIPACVREAYIEQKDHTYAAALVFVIDDENASDFIKMEGYNTPDTAPFFDGIYAGHAYSDYYGEDGKDITLYFSDGNKYHITPDGFFINYTLEEYIFMSPEEYKKCFNEDARNNVFLVKSEGMEIDSIKSGIEDIPGFLFCEDYVEEKSESFLTFIIFVTVISAIYILVAIVMSFLVLKNILAQFVLEKKKELIVMNINGYEGKSCKKYILFDTVLLTVIGLIPGAVIGSIVGYYAVSAFDSPTISLLKDVVWISWVVGVVFTFLLSLINCINAMKRIKRFDISDINK